jgi:phosphoenolpyruvate carboxykinase (ATP)
VNTGWSGGQYGVGSRMNLKYTRAMVQAALTGELRSVETTTDDIFGLHIPTHCPGVPDHVLQPRDTWEDKAAYDVKAKELATNFKDNFFKFNAVNEQIKNAGPK